MQYHKKLQTVIKMKWRFFNMLAMFKSVESFPRKARQAVT